METQARKPLHPLVWIAGIALIVFCGAGAAALMGWIGTGKAVEQSPLVLRAPLGTSNDKIAAPSGAESVQLRLTDSQAQKLFWVETNGEWHLTLRPAVNSLDSSNTVQEVDTKGAGSGVGAVGGAVVGGVLGHQVGDGDQRKIGAVVGAVAGGVVGNEIEKQVRTTKTFEIAVRFDDGSNRVITEATASPWRVGDKVKVVNGVIHNNS